MLGMILVPCLFQLSVANRMNPSSYRSLESHNYLGSRLDNGMTNYLCILYSFKLGITNAKIWINISNENQV